MSKEKRKKRIKTKKVPLWQRVVPRILHSIVWYPTRLLLKYFMHMEIQGAKNVAQAAKRAKKEKRAILFIGNHISEFDPIVSTMATSPFSPAFPLFWVSRPGREYKDPDFSWRKYIYGDLFFLAWGAQPLTSRLKDYEKSLMRHSWLLKNGYSVCIFPEGGYEKKRKSPGGGAGFLAEAWNPILIGIKFSGVEKINSEEFWGRKRFLKVEFGPALEPKDLLDKSLPVPDRYKEMIKKVFKSVNYEID